MKQLQIRHWIFAGLFLIVIIAMTLNVKFNVRVTPETERFYACLDSLPAGATVMVSFDHEASSLPEIRPLALTVLRHAFSRDLKLIGTALLAEGTGVGYRLMTQTAAEYDKTYGEDFVYLGFKPQYIAAILSMGESIPETYPEDYLGQPFLDHPMLRDVKNYDDIAVVISIADGSLTTHWIEYGVSRFNFRLLAAVTAAMMTTYDPYLDSGQLFAMFGGLRGATEYEQLIGIGGSGQRGMLAQSVAHVYVMVLIVIGNVIYFRSRRRKGSAS